MQDNFDEMTNKPTENGEPPKFKVLTEIQAGSVTETDTIDEIEKIEAIDRELEKIPNEKVKAIAKKNIEDIKNSNRRDFRF